MVEDRVNLFKRPRISVKKYIFIGLIDIKNLAGVANLLVSLGHIGRRVFLGQTLNTQILMKTTEQQKGFK